MEICPRTVLLGCELLAGNLSLSLPPFFLLPSPPFFLFLVSLFVCFLFSETGFHCAESLENGS